jgi:hypothetical protein
VQTDANGDVIQVTYTALTARRNIEINRDAAGSLAAGNDHFLTPDELEASQAAIEARDANYVRASRIAINIHSDADSYISSLGCMNVPANRYEDFIREVAESANRTRVLYTLIDASKIDHALLIVEPF